MHFLERLSIEARDVLAFGPAVLLRHARRGKKNYARHVKTKLGKFLVRRHESDMVSLRQIYVDRSYDLSRFPQGQFITERYHEVISEGRIPLIIDAGANAGYATRFFAEQYPKAQVIGIEPFHSNAEICRTNTKFLHNVEIVEAAIGSVRGHVVLSNETAGLNAIRTNRSDAGIDVVTINDILKQNSLYDLLVVKVDIEGFESDLFSANLEWVDIAYAVIVEPHDWMLPGQRSSAGMQRVMLEQERELIVLGENIAWIKRKRGKTPGELGS